MLKANGNVVPRCTARPLQVSEIHNEEVKKMRNVFDKCIEGRWGVSASGPPVSKEGDPSDFAECKDKDEAPRMTPEINEPVNAAGRSINQQPAHDKIINSEVQLQIDEHLAQGKVRRCALGPDGMVVGSHSDNAMLNSIEHEVKFPDGQVKECTANTIAENLSSKFAPKGAVPR